MKKIFSLFFLEIVIALCFLRVQEVESNDNPFKIRSNIEHEIKIFNHGLSSFEERLQLIESAKKTIDIEYFIVKSDISSRIFLQALLKKQAQGVHVRMLIDHTFSASHFNPAIVKELIKKGMDVRYFNPVSRMKLLKVQYRNHRKTLIIDGESVMIGGRNIADEYFDLGKNINFLDRDVVIKGEIVKGIQKSFDETFYSKLSSTTLNDSKGESESAKKFLFEDIEKSRYLEIRDFAIKEHKRTKIEGICKGVSFISEFPTLGRENKNKYRQIKFDLEKRLKLANHEVVIESPYFISTKELKNLYSEMLSKGIAIKVLTNSLNSTDVPVGAVAFDREALGWIKKGMKPYVYKGSRPSDYEVMADSNEETRYVVHAKTLIFDNKDTYIGSYNLDPRSAHYNTELMVACEDSPEIAMHVKADIEKRMENAIELDSKEAFKKAQFYMVSFSKKMKYYAAVLPAILFRHWL